MNNNNITEIPVLILLNEWHKHRSPVTLPIFSDGGAGLCFAGLKLLQALGVMKESLVPCNKTVTAIGGSEISCLGWLPITFKIDDNIMTQPAYTCDKVDKIYFSRKSCLKTNILPALFPFPMPSKEQESVQSVPSHQGMSQIVNQNGYNTTYYGTHTISKPTHTCQLPAEKPAHLPYPATNENVPILKHILDQFSSSAFNTRSLSHPCIPLQHTFILNLMLHSHTHTYTYTHTHTHTNSNSISLETRNQRQSWCWCTERYHWTSTHMQTCSMVFPRGFSYKKRQTL